jgi:hypothetical protein
VWYCPPNRTEQGQLQLTEHLHSGSGPHPDATVASLREIVAVMRAWHEGS